MRNTFSRDKNLYEILLVNRNANKDEIKKSYRKLAMKYHPDRNPNNPTAEEKFKEIQHAYDILSDDFQRMQYNNFLDEVAAENTYTNTYTNSTSNQNSNKNSNKNSSENSFEQDYKDYYQKHQQNQRQQQQQYQYQYTYTYTPNRRKKKGFGHYLLAIFFPFLTFFLIGRPLAGITCLFFQTITADIGHIIAAIWAINSIRKYNNQLDYF